MGGVEGVEKRRREGDQRATGALKRNSRRREGEGRERKFGEGRKEKGNFPLLLSAENTGKRGDLNPLDLMKRVGRVFVMGGFVRAYVQDVHRSAVKSTQNPDPVLIYTIKTPLSC